MQDRNIIGAATSMALMPFVEFYQALTPYIILAIVLIIADSRFGVEAAQKRGEVIRQSRKWRRAINKLVDYICWISLAGVFSNAYSNVLGILMLSENAHAKLIKENKCNVAKLDELAVIM